MKRNVGYLYLLITFFCWGSIYVVSASMLWRLWGPVTVSFLPVWNSSDLSVWYFKVKKDVIKKVQKEHWPYLMILGAWDILQQLYCSLPEPPDCQDRFLP